MLDKILEKSTSAIIDAIGKERISSGKKYFGIIMAEDCRTGCNAVLLPGLKIGPNSVVGPGVVLDNDLGEGKFATNFASNTERQYKVIDNRNDFHKISCGEQIAILKGS
jgi:tetrahydrodipicolinate N-succinyltransferase